MPSNESNHFQDLSRFVIPADFRGRSPLFVQFWWFCDTLLFRTSPQVANGWRVFLLRLFGASIGKSVVIRPSARITYPWKLSIGDFSWIGDDVVLYTLGKISIGSNTVISQRSYLCGGSHDYTDPHFRIVSKPIVVQDECWVAADVFVSPGVEIGRGTVVAARSTITRDLPPGIIAIGSPARVVRERKPIISRDETTSEVLSA